MSLTATGLPAAPALTLLFPSGGQVGTTVDVTATGSFDTWPVSFWCSQDGIKITCEKDKGKIKVEIPARANPGVCWLRAHDSTGASVIRPFVIGTIPEKQEAEPNDEPATAQKIDVASVIINGKLQRSGDVDCYRIRLKKGETLVASLTANEILRAPMDAVMQLVSETGIIYTQNHDWHELDPQISYTAKNDGDYFVRLFAFPSTPDSSIRFFGSDSCLYRLTLTTGGYADYARPLAVQLESPTLVDLVGWNIPPTGRGLKSHATRPGLEILAGPQLANTAELRVEPHPCFDAIEQELTATAAPFTVTGQLKLGPSRIPVLAKKGQPLAIQIEARSLGLPLSPVLRVLDIEGKILQKAEPKAINLDCDLTFSPLSDGKYMIEVQDLHRRHGARMVYRLRVTAARPDFELTVAAERFAVQPGQLVDIPVTVVPANGFKDEVTLSVEGLGSEVTAAEAKGQKTVTLKLKADKEWSGPIKIVGKSKEIERKVATTKLTEFETNSESLWLTSAAGSKVVPVTPKKKK